MPNPCIRDVLNTTSIFFSNVLHLSKVFAQKSLMYENLMMYDNDDSQ